MTRVFFAGRLGGIVMFIWTYFAYTALPLGYIGIHGIPNENDVLDALQKNIGEKSGVYVFPGPMLRPNQTREERAKAMNELAESVARRPSGIMMYSAAGGRPIEMLRLRSVDFAIELAEAMLAVFLLSRTGLTTFGGRAGFVLVTGILVAIATNLSSWNWYGAASYFLGCMLIQVVGFLCVGLVAALVLKRQTLPATSWPRFLPGISLGR
jgi:hypothetical protein